MNKVPIQIMDLTTLKAVVFELSQEIVPSRFENAQQIDSHTLQLGLEHFKNLHGLKSVGLPSPQELSKYLLQKNMVKKAP